MIKIVGFVLVMLSFSALPALAWDGGTGSEGGGCAFQWGDADCYGGSSQ